MLLRPHRTAQLAQLRETVKQMLGVRADVKAHVEALQDMRRQLRPDAEPTDFAAALDAATDALQDRCSMGKSVRRLSVSACADGFSDMHTRVFRRSSFRQSECGPMFQTTCGFIGGSSCTAT